MRDRFAVTVKVEGMISDVEVSRGVCRAGMCLPFFKSWAAKSLGSTFSISLAGELLTCHKIKTCCNFMQQVRCVLEDILHYLTHT